ncbi:MAG: hypothetical protein ACRDIB_10570, partial [Ardenticatenaceae bacterium]
LILLAAWILTFVVGYALLGAPGYWWYMLPVLFGLQVFAALGLGFLLQRPQRSLRIVGFILTVLFVGISLRSAITSVEANKGDRRAATYRAVAAWLEENTTPDSSVAFVEIGYLGYYSNRHIVDLAGLTAPNLTENASRFDLAANFWITTPDYFLYTAAFDWLIGDIVRDPCFVEAYRLAAELPSHFGAPLLIYQRVGPTATASCAA